MSDQSEACRPSSAFGGIIPRAMGSLGVSKQDSDLMWLMF